MQREQFIQQLAEEGFAEPVTIERLADEVRDEHRHPFESKALVLDGGIHIRGADGERFYLAGEIFHLLADEPHSEYYGPSGVVYLMGRKTPAISQS